MVTLAPGAGEHVIVAMHEWRAIDNQRRWDQIMAVTESPDWNEPSTKWHPSMLGAT